MKVGKGAIYIYIHTYRAKLSAVSKVQYIDLAIKLPQGRGTISAVVSIYLKDLKPKCCNTPFSLSLSLSFRFNRSFISLFS